jgi:hypothetical protein
MTKEGAGLLSIRLIRGDPGIFTVCEMGWAETLFSISSKFQLTNFNKIYIFQSGFNEVVAQKFLRFQQ